MVRYHRIMVSIGWLLWFFRIVIAQYIGGLASASTCKVQIRYIPTPIKYQIHIVGTPDVIYYFISGIYQRHIALYLIDIGRHLRGYRPAPASVV